MSREEGADRVAERRSAYYKDVINGLSCITIRKTIAILTILAKGDYKALFLVNISVGRKNGRLIVPALLDTRCRFSIVIDY